MKSSNLLLAGAIIFTAIFSTYGMDNNNNNIMPEEFTTRALMDRVPEKGTQAFANYQHNTNSLIYAIPPAVFSHIFYYIFQTSEDFTDTTRHHGMAMPATLAMDEVVQTYLDLRVTGRLFYRAIQMLDDCDSFQEQYRIRLVRKSLSSELVSIDEPPVLVHPVGFPENMFNIHFNLINADGSKNDEGHSVFKRLRGSFFKAWLKRDLEFVFNNEYKSMYSLLTAQMGPNLDLHFPQITRLSLMPNISSNLMPFQYDSAQLSVVDLSWSGLLCFPIGISKLKNLKFLNLSRNNIDIIPDEILELRFLSDLFLSYNRIIELPKDIGNLQKLVGLKLNHNKLSSLPSSIVNCKNLGTVKLTPPGGAPPFSDISILDLSYNCLTHVPTGLAKLKHLEMLCLSHNMLATLPDDMGDMITLKVLDLSHNQIKFLPKALEGIAGSLKRIDLSFNPFNYFPIEKLQQLKELDITWPDQPVLDNSMIIISLDAKPICIKDPAMANRSTLGSKLVLDRSMLAPNLVVPPAMPGIPTEVCHYCTHYGKDAN